MVILMPPVIVGVEKKTVLWKMIFHAECCVPSFCESEYSAYWSHKDVGSKYFPIFKQSNTKMVQYCWNVAGNRRIIVPKMGWKFEFT